MRIPDDIDFAEVDWEMLATLTRRNADQLEAGARRDAEIDAALACEALAHSRDLRQRSLATPTPGPMNRSTRGHRLD
jgi:hypothetical protein